MILLCSIYSLSRITFPWQCSPLEHQLIFSSSSLHPCWRHRGGSWQQRRMCSTPTEAGWRQRDQLLSNRQRGAWTVFTLHYQALCSLWSPNLRQPKAEPSVCRVSALNNPATPLMFTTSVSVFMRRGSQLRRQRCSSGSCPSTAGRWTRLRRRSCRLACWSSAGDGIGQWGLNEDQRDGKDLNVQLNKTTDHFPVKTLTERFISNFRMYYYLHDSFLHCHCASDLFVPERPASLLLYIAFCETLMYSRQRKPFHWCVWEPL